MILAPWLIALAFVVGMLVLIPARRLRLADLSPQAVGSYALVLWILAMAIAVRPVGVRILVPVLLFAYLAP
ncbi:MAG: hypothetical protein ABIQ58_08110, partial [Candidatus Limnocylindrales bacterium]